MDSHSPRRRWLIPILVTVAVVALCGLYWSRSRLQLSVIVVVYDAPPENTTVVISGRSITDPYLHEVSPFDSNHPKLPQDWDVTDLLSAVQDQLLDGERIETLHTTSRRPDGSPVQNAEATLRRTRRDGTRDLIVAIGWATPEANFATIVEFDPALVGTSPGVITAIGDSRRRTQFSWRSANLLHRQVRVYVDPSP